MGRPTGCEKRLLDIVEASTNGDNALEEQEPALSHDPTSLRLAVAWRTHHWSRTLLGGDIQLRGGGQRAERGYPEAAIKPGESGSAHEKKMTFAEGGVRPNGRNYYTY